MPRNPVAVVEEFLNFPDPRVRRNALAALGEIRDEKSLKMLAAMGVSGDPVVSKDVIHIVQRLPPADSRRVVELAWNLAVSSESQNGGYAFLAALKHLGVDVPRYPMGIAQRFRL